MTEHEKIAWRALTAAIDTWCASPCDELWAHVEAAWTTYHATN